MYETPPTITAEIVGGPEDGRQVRLPNRRMLAHMTNTSRNLVHCYLACDPDRRLPRTIGYLGLRTDDHAIGILARMRLVEESFAIEAGEVPGQIQPSSYPLTAADFETERLKREQTASGQVRRTSPQTSGGE